MFLFMIVINLIVPSINLLDHFNLSFISIIFQLNFIVFKLFVLIMELTIKGD